MAIKQNMVEDFLSRICPKEITRDAHQDSESYFITLLVNQKLEATMMSSIMRLEDSVSFKVRLLKVIGKFSLTYKPVNERENGCWVKSVSREMPTKYSHGKRSTSWKFETGRNLSGEHPFRIPAPVEREKERSVKTRGARGVLGEAVTFDPISGKRLELGRTQALAPDFVLLRGWVTLSTPLNSSESNLFTGKWDIC